MARIFITGSAGGLGRAAAETLLGDGHEVMVHAQQPSAWPRSMPSSTAARRPLSGTWRTETRSEPWPPRSTAWVGSTR